MNDIMRSVVLRPLAVLTITFYVVLCILFTAEEAVRLLSAVIFFAMSAVFVTASLLLSRKNALRATVRQVTVRAVAFFFVGAFLASACAYGAFDIGMKRFDSVAGREVSVRATVSEVIWSKSYGGAYIIEVESAGGLGGFTAVADIPACLSEGDGVCGEAELSRLSSDGDFDERRYYYSKGAVVKAEFSHAEKQTEKGAQFFLFSAARSVRNSLSEVFYKYLGEEEGGFAAALLLGNKEYLSKTVDRDFMRLGISHILAISGMHLAVLCAFVSRMLLPFGKKAARVGCVVLVLFYMFITGLSPSVTRSGIMLLILLAAETVKRGSDRFTNLGLAVFIICMLDPLSASSISLQLSFGAVLAILLYTERVHPLSEKQRDMKEKKGALALLLGFLRGLWEGCVLTVVVVLFILPLEWLYFGEMSLVSPVTSPVFSLFCNVLLWVLPIFLLLSPIGFVASAFGGVLSEYIGFICTLANKLSLLRNILISLKYPLAGAFAVAVFVSIVVFCCLKGKRRAVAAAVTAALLAGYSAFGFFWSERFKDCVIAEPLTHNANDGLLLVSEGRSMIIDVGDGYSRIIEAGQRAESERQATETEAILLTHLHKSCVSSLSRIFERSVVRRVYIPEGDGEIEEELSAVCRENGVEAVVYSLGDTVKFGAAEVKTAPHLYIDRSVQPSVRLDISAFGETVTYVGGAYLEAGGGEMKESDAVWYGDHGPLYKKSFEDKSPAACAIVASKNAKEYLIGECIPEEEVDCIILGSVKGSDDDIVKVIE